VEQAGAHRVPTLPAPNFAVEPTADSFRSYVAPAIGGGSPRAFGYTRLEVLLSALNRTALVSIQGHQVEGRRSSCDAMWLNLSSPLLLPSAS